MDYKPDNEGAANMYHAMYKEHILDHYRHPRNSGVMEKPDATARGISKACGDFIDVFLRIKGDVLEDIKYDSIGCAISIASASILSEHIKGKPLDYIMKMTQDDVLKLMNVQLSAAKMHCTLPALEATQGAIEIYRKGHASTTPTGKTV